jgi:hypothetical protein
LSQTAYATRAQVLVRRPPRQLSQETRLLLVIAAALALAAAGLIYVHEAKLWFADASQATLASFAIAAAAGIPMLCFAYFSLPQRWMRWAVLAWLPLKAVLLWGAPPVSVFLSSGDNPAWHRWAVGVAHFWRAGGNWIPSTAFLNSISMPYPGAVHLFGLPYLVFGDRPYVVVPWLGFIQLATACCMPLVAARAKLPPRVGGLMLLYLLFCPAWLSLTNQLFRDPLLAFGLVLTAIGVLDLKRGRLAAGLAVAAVGIVVVLSLREQYVLFFLVFGLFAIFVGRVKLVKLIPLLLVLLLAGSMFVTRFRPDAVASRYVLGRSSTYTGEFQDVRHGSFVGMFARVTPYSLPVAVPFRLLAALVAPFPWANSQVSLSDQTGHWWVYAVLHVSQALLHLAMVICILVAILHPGALLFRTDSEVFLLLIYGVGLILAGALAMVGFGRYVLLGFPFLLPAVYLCAQRWRFREAVAMSAVFVWILHIAYYSVRGW